MKALATLQKQLAPTGVLRAAVNLSNPLLIQSHDPIAGVSPSLAHVIASRLKVPLKIIPYDHPDQICNAAEQAITSSSNVIRQTPWDIALIAADSDRAKYIDFTPAYCEIQATCMVRKSSPILSFEDVNKKGISVSVKGGGAYDLWLTRNWKNAALVRSRTLDLSYDAYIEENLDVLAGLRPRLLDDLKKCDGHRILDGSFMSVQQAIGCFKVFNDDNASVSPGFEFLSEFVNEVRQPGNIVQSLIEKHGMTGRLSLPLLS